ncbi:MAG: fatty acid desaturase [Gemmatimonadota bacterium]
MPGFAALAEPWWIAFVYLAVLGHITNICVTLYLHRSATHGGVRFHPLVEHFMRGWLWLTTGMNTREWVAVHRKHHAFSDKPGDPHSPHEEGFWHIVLAGLWFYKEAIQDDAMLEKYGKGTPDDWVERNVYKRHRWTGLLSMLVLNVFLFGPLLGLLVWSGMAVWIPIFGAMINGVGHALGYRNFDTKDESRNIYPLGVWIVGEELHNNHHADPRSARFNARWWEFDIGWLYIRLLSAFSLAEVVYARTLNVREFTAKYYEGGFPQPLAARVETASERVDRAREEFAAWVDRVSASARAELDVRAAALEQMVQEAKAELAHLREEAAVELERVKGRMEEIRHEALHAIEQRRARVDQVKASVRAEIDEAVDAARAALDKAVAEAEALLNGGTLGPAGA